MISRSEFLRRRDQFCIRCDFWKGVCLKGHSLSSAQGCPLRKFDPVDGADYAADAPVAPAEDAPKPGGCCGGEADVEPMTWTQAVSHLAASMRDWVKAGVPLTPDDVYNTRVDTCKNECPHYRHFQCRLCKCLVMAKARVPGEKCPADRWPPL